MKNIPKRASGSTNYNNSSVTFAGMALKLFKKMVQVQLFQVSTHVHPCHPMTKHSLLVFKKDSK